MKVMGRRKALLLGLVGVGYAAVQEYRQPTLASACNKVVAGCTAETISGVSYLKTDDAACCECWGYNTKADNTMNQDLNVSVKGEGDKSITALLNSLNKDDDVNFVVFGTDTTIDYTALNTPTSTLTEEVDKTAGILLVADGSADLAADDPTIIPPVVDNNGVETATFVQVNAGNNKGLKGKITAVDGNKVTVEFNSYKYPSYTELMKFQGNGKANADRQQIKLCAPTSAETLKNMFPCANAREDVWTTEENYPATGPNAHVLSQAIENDKTSCRNFGRQRATESDEGLLVQKAGEALCLFEFEIGGDDDHVFKCRSKASYEDLAKDRGGEKAGIWILIVFIAILCAWPACQKWPLYKRICNADHDFCCKSEKRRLERQATASLMSRSQSQYSPKTSPNEQSETPGLEEPNPNDGGPLTDPAAEELSGSVPVKMGDPDVNKLPDVPKSTDGS